MLTFLNILCYFMYLNAFTQCFTEVFSCYYFLMNYVSECYMLHKVISAFHTFMYIIVKSSSFICSHKPQPFLFSHN